MKSKNLSEIQNAIQRSVREQNLPKELVDLILEKPPISIEQRFKIYKDAYLIRISESLKDDFGRVAFQLSEVEFESLILNFISANPSRTKNLAEYSEGFPQYLKESRPWLFESALKDWISILSEHSAEPEMKLTIAEIQSGMAFIFRTHPASQLRELEKKNLLGFALENQVQFLELSDLEAKLFIHLRGGRTPEEIEEFAIQNQMTEVQLSAVIQNWTKKNIIYCQGAPK